MTSFFCNNCEKKYSNINKFNNHKCSYEHKVFNSCFECNKIIEKECMFQKHVKTHKKEPIYSSLNCYFNIIIYNCNYCSLLFNSKKELNEHIKFHDIQNFISCVECDRISTTEILFKKHLNIHNTKCLKCNKECINNKALKNHRCCVEFAIYSCLQCHEIFDSFSLLKKHYHSHDTQFYSCLECNKILTYEYRLKNHNKTHSKRFKYNCNQCNKTFFIEERLNKHIEGHKTEKLLECLKCPRKFRLQYYLNKHLISHSNIRKFKCQICNAKFKEPSTLKDHENTHKNIIVAECEICGRGFTRKSSCKTHLKSHTTPYKQRQKKKEQKIAEFLDRNNILYNREHRIDFGDCIDSKEGQYCMLDFTLLTKNGNYMIILECDEFQHKDYPMSCEMRRMNDAYTSILTDKNPLKGVHWIRYNPDSFKIDNIRQDYKIDFKLNKLKETIINIQNNPPKNNFTITYLFYDITDKKVDILNNINFPKHYKKITYNYPN